MRTIHTSRRNNVKEEVHTGYDRKYVGVLLTLKVLVATIDAQWDGWMDG